MGFGSVVAGTRTVAIGVGSVAAGARAVVVGEIVGNAVVAVAEGKTAGDVAAAAGTGAGTGLDGTVLQPVSRRRINSRWGRSVLVVITGLIRGGQQGIGRRAYAVGLFLLKLELLSVETIVMAALLE